MKTVKFNLEQATKAPGGVEM